MRVKKIILAPGLGTSSNPVAPAESLNLEAFFTFQVL